MKSHRMTRFSIKEIMHYLEQIFLKRWSNNFFYWILAADVFFWIKSSLCLERIVFHAFVYVIFIICQYVGWHDIKINDDDGMKFSSLICKSSLEIADLSLKHIVILLLENWLISKPLRESCKITITILN